MRVHVRFSLPSSVSDVCEEPFYRALAQDYLEVPAADAHAFSPEVKRKLLPVDHDHSHLVVTTATNSTTA